VLLLYATTDIICYFETMFSQVRMWPSHNFLISHVIDLPLQIKQEQNGHTLINEVTCCGQLLFLRVTWALGQLGPWALGPLGPWSSWALRALGPLKLLGPWALGHLRSSLLGSWALGR
jgi:hypothetical protein